MNYETGWSQIVHQYPVYRLQQRSEYQYTCVYLSLPSNDQKFLAQKKDNDI